MCCLTVLVCAVVGGLQREEVCQDVLRWACTEATVSTPPSGAYFLFSLVCRVTRMCHLVTFEVGLGYGCGEG